MTQTKNDWCVGTPYPTKEQAEKAAAKLMTLAKRLRESSIAGVQRRQPRRIQL
jgi:hypothetical protein